MITGKILKRHGWPEGKTIGLAKAAAGRLEATGMGREAVLEALDRVRVAPSEHVDDPALATLVAGCLRLQRRAAPLRQDILREVPLPYRVWGAEGIDPGTIAQMDAAMRLPVSVAGALMPDAHVGYGLPIGGVLATEGMVIPYAIGVDIACRMRLSVYPLSPAILDQKEEQFAHALLSRTAFGAGAAWSGSDRAQHEVLDDPAWNATKLLKSLRGKAEQQLGTSGTGNHFVEFGSFTLVRPDPGLGLDPGDYLALLSHSGSRAVGFKIANTYSALAEQAHPGLEKSLRHLAWLDMDSEAGQEYWLSMELAGRFASANHAVIHRRVAAALGLKELAAVENHHNFAWRESVTLADGSSRELLVHRKGATPAGAGVLGIIPGSMGDPGYLVRGRGEATALHSASHGAGRLMSRRSALDTITKTMRDRYLRERGVTLLGGGIDESPQAYKPIESVIAAQRALVETIGSFAPRIVRMADEPGDI